MSEVSKSECMDECDAVIAMCGVGTAVGGIGLSLAEILAAAQAIRALVALVNNPEVVAALTAAIKAIKALFGSQPVTPDGVV